MSPSRAYWFVVAAVHLLWVVLFPDLETRGIAIVGAIAAVLAHAAGLRHFVGTGTIWRDVLGLLPFLWPAAALIVTPRLAFWWLDGGGWLLLVWLTVAAAGALSTSERPERARLWAYGFLFWTSLFWLSVVWDLGVRDAVLLLDRSSGMGCSFDPLTVMFRVWEQHPVSEHALLGWRLEGAFEAGEPYARHTPPFLLSMYGWVSAVRGLTGLSLPAASNSTMLLHAIVLLSVTTVLIARLGLMRRAHEATGLIVLFLSYGFVTTTWRLWTDLFRFASDNMFPLQGAMLVLAAAAFIPPWKPRLALAAGAGFVVPGPLYAPFFVLAGGLVFGVPATTFRELVTRNRALLQVSLWVFIVAGVALAMPLLLIAWKGFAAYSQPLLVRSGLDGSTTYFDTLFRAFWRGHSATCFPRGPSDLFLPAFLPLLAAAPFAFRHDHGFTVHPAKVLLFACTPYVMSWVLFPQALSIHPYLYDHFLLMPVVAIGVALLLAEPVWRRLTGSWLLVLILLLTGATMSNLISTAQWVVAMKLNP